MNKAKEILNNANFTLTNGIISWNDNIPVGVWERVLVDLSVIGYKVVIKKNVHYLTQI